jgi:hypothetical protein
MMMIIIVMLKKVFVIEQPRYFYADWIQPGVQPQEQKCWGNLAHSSRLKEKGMNHDTVT